MQSCPRGVLRSAVLCIGLLPALRAQTSATFGEVMCTTYKAFGAAGLITSGAARDLDQVEAMNFPCFADGAICAELRAPDIDHAALTELALGAKGPAL